MTIPHYPSYPLLAPGMETGTRQHRGGDAGDTHPLEELLPAATGRTRAQMWFPMGPSWGVAVPGVPPDLPTHAPTQHRTHFLPRCNTPLPAACVTRRCQHKERGQLPAHAWPGTHRVSIPPRLLANPARGSRGRGATPGLHWCCRLWKIGQKPSGLGDLSAPCPSPCPGQGWEGVTKFPAPPLPLPKPALAL